MCTKEVSSYTDSGNKIMKVKRRHSNFSEMFDFHFAKVTLRLKKRSWSVLYGLTTKPPTCDVPLFFLEGGGILKPLLVQWIRLVFILNEHSI